MKKIIVLFLLFVPVVSFGVPTVRNLGNTVSASAAASVTGQPDAKIMPARAAVTPKVSTSANTSSRIGTMRVQNQNPKISASDSRFPVATYGKAFNTISAPKYAEPKTQKIDTEEIVDNVIVEIGSRDLYVPSNGFEEAVRNVDNPKFDTVSVGAPQDITDVPGRVYMWVEMNNSGN